MPIYPAAQRASYMYKILVSFNGKRRRRYKLPIDQLPYVFRGLLFVLLLRWPLYGWTYLRGDGLLRNYQGIAVLCSICTTSFMTTSIIRPVHFVYPQALFYPYCTPVSGWDKIHTDINLRNKNGAKDKQTNRGRQKSKYRCYIP